MTYFIRSNGWWPKPYVSGGPKEWTVPDNFKPTRKKSTTTHLLCVDGPLHGVRIKTVFTIGRNRKLSLVDPNLGFNPYGEQLSSPMNHTFAVPPYRGKYIYDKEQNLYYWDD